MTATDPTAPATPGETLRWAVKRLMARSDAGEMHIAAAWLAVWADELDAARATDPAPATPPEHQPGARTYELPAEPPVGERLRTEDGAVWFNDRSESTRPWRREVNYRGERVDPEHATRMCWSALLDAYGPLSTTPPTGTDPASATAVDPPAGTVGT